MRSSKVLLFFKGWALRSKLRVLSLSWHTILSFHLFRKSKSCGEENMAAKQHRSCASSSTSSLFSLSLKIGCQQFWIWKTNFEFDKTFFLKWNLVETLPENNFFEAAGGGEIGPVSLKVAQSFSLDLIKHLSCSLISVVGKTYIL